MWRSVAGTLAALAILAVLGATAWSWGRAQFERPGPLAAEAVVVLPRGIGLDEIARRLADAGVIDRAWLFRLGVRLSGAARNLQAGEFAFPSNSSQREVMAHLVSGKPVARRLTVPEGLTTRQVVALISATSGLAGAIVSVPAEGALLPETYHYAFGDGRADMVRRMEAAMTELLVGLWESRQAGLPLRTQAEAVALASIVERESARPDERRHVAGVFVNRLRRGMRLQSDPTVIYALSGGATAFDHELSRADLAVDSTYNTYRVAGLPPGPIANPGRDSIAAVLDPLLTEDLYFVNDGAGGLAFARTLAAHNRNVARWRKLRQSQATSND